MNQILSRINLTLNRNRNRPQEASHKFVFNVLSESICDLQAVKHEKEKLILREDITGNANAELTIAPTSLSINIPQIKVATATIGMSGSCPLNVAISLSRFNGLFI
jgi:hypothetical protein